MTVDEVLDDRFVENPIGISLLLVQNLAQMDYRVPVVPACPLGISAPAEPHDQANGLRP